MATGIVGRVRECRLETTGRRNVDHATSGVPVESAPTGRNPRSVMAIHAYFDCVGCVVPRPANLTSEAHPRTSRNKPARSEVISIRTGSSSAPRSHTSVRERLAYVHFIAAATVLERVFRKEYS